MFTGIVSDIGRVAASQPSANGARLAIDCAYDAASIDIGASIACAGVCLTVVELKASAQGCRFKADMSVETLSCTTLGDYAAGMTINLERALKASDELGGHMMLGHVDGVAQITKRETDGESVRFALKAPHELARFIAPKGSIALDGTSLTVNEVAGAEFSINIVPHTARVTSWGEREAGDRVNLEVDLLARYLARLIDAGES